MGHEDTKSPRQRKGRRCAIHHHFILKAKEPTAVGASAFLFLPFVPWCLGGSTVLSGSAPHWLTVTLNDTVLALAGARLPVKVHLIAPLAPTPGEVTAMPVTLLGNAP